jgi:hypothetical protein
LNDAALPQSSAPTLGSLEEEPVSSIVPAVTRAVLARAVG